MKQFSQDSCCEEYMRYLGVAKTARRSYAESVRLLKGRDSRSSSRIIHNHS